MKKTGKIITNKEKVGGGEAVREKTRNSEESRVINEVKKSL